MSIDWITVGAQIVNFLVLVWLLKRFLYRPILDGIDAREAEIAARMGEAAKICEAAETTEADYQRQIAQLQASRADMLKEARKAAEAERDTLLSDVRTRIAAEAEDREKHRSQEARAFSAELHKNGAAALLALTRKALSDLADETLEQRIVAHAVTQLNDSAEALRKAAGDSRKAVALTRDPLPKAAQDDLRRELKALLPDYDLTFKTDSGLSPGLNLRLGGAQVSWSVDSYLKGLDAALEAQTGRPVRQGLADAT